MTADNKSILAFHLRQRDWFPTPLQLDVFPSSHDIILVKVILPEDPQLPTMPEQPMSLLNSITMALLVLFQIVDT